MSEIQEHVAHLSQAIGPRPAGTEEEQQAALYLSEVLQEGAGLAASVEEFNCNPNYELPRGICCVLSIIAVVLGIFLSAALIPAIIVGLIAVVLYAAEIFDFPLLSRLFNRGVSQNVVAKCEPAAPAAGTPSRRRKVVLVAHYDSGKVRKDVNSPLFPLLSKLRWVELVALVAAPVLLLIRLITAPTGTLLIVSNVLLVVVIVLTLLPVIALVMNRMAPYSEGANCNASGVAVLMEVATRIGRGRLSEEEISAHEVALHGEEAALASGFVPEGAEFVYDTPVIKEPEFAEESPAERLMAAKAAVAALSGKPVSNTINIDISENLVQVKKAPVAAQSPDDMRERREEAINAFAPVAPGDDSIQIIEVQDIPEEEPANAPASVEAPAPLAAVPAWFTAAQEKAKKPTSEPKPQQRSRYAAALDAAVRESSEHFERANEAVASETEQRIQNMTDHIVEVKAPKPEVEVLPASTVPMPAVVAGQEPATTSVSANETVGVAPAVAPAPAAAPVTSAVTSAAPAVSPALAPVPAPVPSAEETLDRTMAFIPVAREARGRVDAQELTVPEVKPATPAQPTQRKKRAITLPSLTGSLKPLEEERKQRAPLAEGRTRSSLSAVIPRIGEAPRAAAAYEDDSSSRHAALRDALPSLSGVVGSRDVLSAAEEPQEEQELVSQAGSFAPVGATGAFAPIGDELLEDVAPEDMYVEDADDSAYEDQYTETGAFAGPGYVEMPKSRSERFFDKFRFGRKSKKKQQEESTPQQWLNVNDDFEARSVGQARGGWESFREEDNDYYYEDESYESYEDEDYGYEDEQQPTQRWNGGGFSREQLELSQNEAELAGDVAFDASLNMPLDDVHAENVQRIYGFRHPDINTEVWFVALGSELADNGGMKAFIAEHADELRGSIFIDLDSLGAGKLTLIEQEGTYRSVKASARMKRYTRKASAALGMTVGSGTMLWKDSSAVCAMRHGYQAMHLAGMEGDKPAFYGTADDVAENVNTETMLQNADFVMEVLKGI